MHDALHSKKISDLTLERFALRELPAAEMREIQARLAVDPALRERLRALEESSAAILRATPPEAFAARVRALERKHRAENAARDGFGFRSLGAWKPLLGSLALLVVLAVPIGLLGPRRGADGIEGGGQGAPASPASSAPSAPSATPAAPTASAAASAEMPAIPAEEEVRLKGLEPRLALFRKTDSGAAPVRPGEKAVPGEVLRIGYQAAGFSYGVILSVDGNGNVTRHWPVAGDLAGRLEKGDALLPSSFELDAAPDFERFYFVVSNTPFEMGLLLESLHNNKSLPVTGKGATAGKPRVVRFEVLKESL